LVSSWSKIRFAWLLADGVAVALADAPGAVAAVADDGVVVALDGAVAAVGVDVLDDGAAAGVAVAADDDEGVVDVSACANCTSSVDDARMASSAAAQAVPATPMAAAATTVASQGLKQSFIMDSSIDRMAAPSAA
jgi:hypothetical protein